MLGEKWKAMKVVMHRANAMKPISKLLVARTVRLPKSISRMSDDGGLLAAAGAALGAGAAM